MTFLCHVTKFWNKSDICPSCRGSDEPFSVVSYLTRSSRQSLAHLKFSTMGIRIAGFSLPTASIASLNSGQLGYEVVTP